MGRSACRNFASLRYGLLLLTAYLLLRYGLLAQRFPWVGAAERICASDVATVKSALVSSSLKSSQRMGMATPHPRGLGVSSWPPP